MKKTKIVATIGPASIKKEVLREMILSGLNVCRLNFSHGSYDVHEEAIKVIRELNEE
jgi:pyruvate kinase